MLLKLDVKPRARILTVVSVSDACCPHVTALGQNSEESHGGHGPRNLHAFSQNGKLGEAEAGDSEVDLDGERRRMLQLCTLRYRARKGSACQHARPFHVAKNGMSRSGADTALALLVETPGRTGNRLELCRNSETVQYKRERSALYSFTLLTTLREA